MNPNPAPSFRIADPEFRLAAAEKELNLAKKELAKARKNLRVLSHAGLDGNERALAALTASALVVARREREESSARERFLALSPA